MQLEMATLSTKVRRFYFNCKIDGYFHLQIHNRFVGGNENILNDAAESHGFCDRDRKQRHEIIKNYYRRNESNGVTLNFEEKENNFLSTKKNFFFI